MVVVGLVFAGLATLVHVYIFVLESFAWTGDRARSVFGMGSEQARTTRELALNQGFYNLFLSVSTGLGIAFTFAGFTEIGATLVFTGAGSMAAAGLVLLLSSPSKAGAALKQLMPPLLGIAYLAVGLAM